MPKSNSKLPGILIELKAEKFVSSDELKRLAKTAIDQINEKQYETEMKAHGIDNIIKYGIAFSGISQISRNTTLLFYYMPSVARCKSIHIE